MCSHFIRHWRFYISILAGVGSWVFASGLSEASRIVAAGDAFFIFYLVAMSFVVWNSTPDKLRKRAADEDEGVALVILIALAVIAVSCVAIVIVLRQKQQHQLLPLELAIAGVPLGWFMLHTLAAFHYADLYYARKGNAAQSIRGLDFPDTKEPGVWEFLYYAFTVGMTAQTSDTNLLDAKMRRATLGHSVVSFFYYTAIIAMSVNAVVALAS